MNNLLSYCGLVDARISASEKDLPVIPIRILDRTASLSIMYTYWETKTIGPDNCAIFSR